MCTRHAKTKRPTRERYHNVAEPEKKIKIRGKKVGKNEERNEYNEKKVFLLSK